MLQQVAYTNLLQHHIPPAQIWETTWPEYLLAVIGWQQQHPSENKAGESVTPQEAARRIRERRAQLNRR
jgi:hypothetical protein